jgi:anti-sigma factor RsiW
VSELYGGLDCSAVVGLINQYLDDSLDAATRSRLEHHIRECDHCKRYLAQIQQTAKLLSGLGKDDIPDDVLNAFQRMLASRKNDS